MKLRESMLIILGVGLLSSTIYCMLNENKLAEENKKITNEFLTYKTNLHKDKALAQAMQKAQLIKEKEQEREKLRLSLKEKVQKAYTLAHRLDKKYKNKANKKLIILESLNQTGVYIKNYAGNQVGDVPSFYLVDSIRAVPLEEIQKVRRHKEGYIKIKSDNSKQVEYIYVKDLEINQLFIGAYSIIINQGELNVSK